MMFTYLHKEQAYSNRFSAERTRDHTNVKILIPSNKGKCHCRLPLALSICLPTGKQLTNLKSTKHTKKKTI